MQPPKQSAPNKSSREVWVNKFNWIKHWLMEQVLSGALIAQQQARKIAPQPLNNL